ncbi:Bifunctional pantoate ligase/cytidylate kinase [Trichinella spiralis]|uniref:Bifunctional pantoate ligase/cytidylate kinase n=1 Tax=Trichinella spiralis TaxID=6334 RepID=A0ABR3KKJ6_TRISP
MHVRLGLLFTIVGLIRAFDPLFKDANVQIESTDAHHHLVVRNAELQEQTPCVPDLNGDTSHCAKKRATKTAVTEAKPRSRRCARCRSECGCGAAPMPIPAAPPPMDADVPVSRDVDADKDAVVGNEDADVDREDADVDREDAVVARDAPVDRDAVAGREGAAVDRELVDVRQSQHHYHHHHPPWYDPLRYRIV